MAWESDTSGAVSRAPLHSETTGGVWRVWPRAFAPGVDPTIELISPPLGRDSALFNRVCIRLRALHTPPLESQISLLWKNVANEDHLGLSKRRREGKSRILSGRAGAIRRRRGLSGTVASGRADAHPQDGQTRIDARTWS